MKCLMIYCNKFSYRPAIKTIDEADAVESVIVEHTKVQTAFIQVEVEDTSEDRLKYVETKMVKNLKWVAGKNKTKKIILHSFAHLSESKAQPEVTKEIFNKVETRLIASGYEVHQTPFGYFLDLNIDAPGFSLARVFKSF